MIKNACLAELAQGKDTGWDAQKTLEVIDEFFRFCWLMSHPDNHIQSSTGQYTEKLVPSRPVRDMIDEMSQELTNLPRYTAYVKLLQEKDGIQITLKRKLLPLPPLLTDEATHAHIEQQAIQRTHVSYCTDRDRIDEELRSRHDAWRQAAHRSASHWRKRFGLSPAFKAPGPEEPPPTLG